MSFLTNLILVFLTAGLNEGSSTDNTDTWPSGGYGLPKAISGCPAEHAGMSWKEGWIQQDLENLRNQTSTFSTSFHMDAILSDHHITRNFCIHTENEVRRYYKLWPKGSYCIYKKQYYCPSNMVDGSIRWDDEDNANDNRRYGTLPDGVFDDDTIINYCCQDQGYWFNSIELPTDRPFNLLPHKSPHCQRVKWALSSLEYIVYDTENNNNGDQFFGSHVFTNEVKSLPKIYYCYYQGCRYKLYGDSGSLASSGISTVIYPDFQYCSWLITVKETVVISLSFTIIRIPNCKENYIDIYDGSDETFPLLARYCGLNATVGNKVRSTGNTLYMVLKSGNNSLDQDMHPEFNANYKTQLTLEKLVPVWPYGSYGLPKAKSGCPGSGGEEWAEGYIMQDMENDSPHKSEVSPSFHMEAKLSKYYKNINRTFCIKTHPGTYKRSWPKGSYCIYKKNRCPFGMLDGSTTWDDEDDKNNNHQSGILPDGIYDSDYFGLTIIYYCCQEQGYWFNSIELPVDRPFYLLPHRSPHCQRVKWALSSLEYIVYDTENNYNHDRFTASHVFSNEIKSLPKIFYCYYQGCRQKLNSSIGSFSSSRNISDIYPDFQYCSWLITVNKSLLVSLSFTSIQIPNCQENYMDIYDGRNETFPLLARYCGFNATKRNKVKSTGNNLYVVLKSGNNSLNPGIHLTFYANYWTDLMPKQTRPTSAPTNTKELPLTNTNSDGPIIKLHSSGQSISIKVIIIVIPTLAGLFIIVSIILIIFRRRQKNIGGMEADTKPNLIHDRAKMKEVSLAGKEQDNPIYEPGTDTSPSSGMYASVDNVEYEPYIDNTANDKDDQSSFYNQPDDIGNIYSELNAPGNPIYEPPPIANLTTKQAYRSADNVEYEPYNAAGSDKDDPSSFYDQLRTHPDVGLDKNLTNPDDEAIYESIK